MGDQPNKRGGLFGNYNNSPYGSPNVSVSADHSGLVSPYMNFDPAILGSGSDYILPEGSNRERGRFEVAFSHIGGAVMAGAATGGIMGMYKLNFPSKSMLATPEGKLKFENYKKYTFRDKAWRAMNFNAVAETGGSVAGSLGTIMVIYSAFGVFFELMPGINLEYYQNSVLSGTLTGCLYKASKDLTKVARGGLMGFGISAIIAGFQYMQKNKSSTNF